MARRLAPPRLYLDPKRHTWGIRDRGITYRTGIAKSQRDVAEQALARYLADKHTPQPSASPLIADVMMVYLKQHITHAKSRRSNMNAVKNIGLWWGDKRVTDITPDNCRAYIAHKGRSASPRATTLKHYRKLLAQVVLSTIG
jgi:hypothetical protein